jgi:predicted transcriptional regulator
MGEMMNPTFRDLPQLTPAELEVMKVLWDSDGLSAREVHQRVVEIQDWAYSTTRTTVERMVRKGLVEKNSFHGLHVYRATVSRASGLARMVRDFAHQVLETSYAPVVSLFADSGALSPEEIEELNQLLEETAGKEKKS